MGSRCSDADAADGMARQGELAKQQAIEATVREVARQRQQAEAKLGVEQKRTRPQAAPKKERRPDVNLGR